MEHRLQHLHQKNAQDISVCTLEIKISAAYDAIHHFLTFEYTEDNNIEFITGCTGIRTISVTITTTVGPSVLPSLSMPSHPHPQHLVTIAPAPNEVQIRDSLADIPDGFDIDADRIPEIVVPDDCCKHPFEHDS